MFSNSKHFRPCTRLYQYRSLSSHRRFRALCPCNRQGEYLGYTVVLNPTLSPHPFNHSHCTALKPHVSATCVCAAGTHKSGEAYDSTKRATLQHEVGHPRMCREWRARGRYTLSLMVPLNQIQPSSPAPGLRASPVTPILTLMLNYLRRHNCLNLRSQPHLTQGA